MQGTAGVGSIEHESQGGLADFYRTSAYADFPQEHRSAGSLGVSFISADQQPHEMVDPPIPEMLVQLCRYVPGPAHYNLGDRWVTNSLGSGSIMVTPPDTEVAYKAPIPHKLLLLTFPKDSLAAALGDERDNPADVLSALWERPFLDATIFAIGHRMWAEAAMNERASALFVDSAALALIALLMRASGGRQPSAPADRGSARVVGRVRDYVEAHLSEGISLGDLASVACLSPYHFSRTFKAATGRTPLAFVMERRVERAKSMLVADLAPLAEIAYACGFANQAHFTTVFAKQVGTTPGAYRQALRS